MEKLNPEHSLGLQLGQGCGVLGEDQLEDDHPYFSAFSLGLQEGENTFDPSSGSSPQPCHPGVSALLRS